MMTAPRLEHYLTRLDKALGQIPIGDRSEIITEIKSHVLEAQDKDPNQSLDQVLAAIGEPEQVANRYLLERGIKTVRPSKSPIVKWLTIGFLGTFGISVILIFGLIWRFTPLLRVDQNTGRVTILGGLIDVDDTEGSVQVGGMNFSANEVNQTFTGKEDIVKQGIREMQIQFSNTKMEISSSSNSQIYWKCKYQGAAGAATSSLKNGILALNLENLAGSKCDIQLPEKIATKIRGSNGKLEIHRPKSNLDIALDNGKIALEPDENHAYHYDLTVRNGSADSFESSSKVDATRINIALVNGLIKRE